MPSSIIQWYPGHIAKAQQQLKNQLKLVDVVLEVLDARIPLSSCHPDLDSWLQNTPRLRVLNKVDQIAPQVKQGWLSWFRQGGVDTYATNGRSGEGIKALRLGILSLGAAVNCRRQERGMRPRPIRAVVVGFPNVGKSALLNRLLGRRVVESAARPGVTRQLRWVRIGADLELLDAPGIIPPQLDNQDAAVKLAICDDIGQAAYTAELVAALFLDLLTQLHEPSLPLLQERYGLTNWDQPGSILLDQLAHSRFQGDLQRTSQRVLTDYRKGLLGPLALEFPPAATPTPPDRAPSAVSLE